MKTEKIFVTFMLLSAAVFAVGGGGGGGPPDPCSGFICNNPPPETCNGSALIMYAAPGVCNNGICTYSYSSVDCQYGCSYGQCNAAPEPPQNQTVTIPEQTQPPATEPPRKFSCFELSTIEERVDCRLELDEYEQQEELKVQYLPEECRALTGAGRDECVKVYDGVQKCWMFPEGASRVGCVRDSLGFTSISNEKENCDLAPDKTTCAEKLKKNVYAIIKFRIYDLEERAEELYTQYPGQVSKFVTDLEKKKQEFNDATAIAGKRQVVLGVRELWKSFVAEVRA